MFDGGWLFPGLNPGECQLNRAIHGVAEAAEINKRVSMHTLRHYSEFGLTYGSRLDAQPCTM